MGRSRLPALALVLAAAPAAADGIVGRFEGELRFRGDALPVRLRIEPADGGLRAELDVPSLLLAWEPVPAARAGDGVEVELPFGLGALALAPAEDGGLHGAKSIGEDELAAELAPAGAPPYARHDLSIASGGVALAATLVLPDEAGPRPGVVLVHGSGAQGRAKWEYRSWADLLARHGCAVLLYDKRGTGASGGEEGAGLRVLAGDAAAAVGALHARPEVDAERVGLLGWSQGAWIAEQVAADLGDLAFLVLVSAAGSTPRDQELQQVEHGMRADGRSEEEIEDALAYLGLYFYVVRTGEGWPLLAAAAERAAREEWGGYVDQPRSPADLAWWRANHDFQPASVVARLDLPVLVLYGAADWITPPAANADRLRAAFPAEARVDVRVFERADHRLEVPAWRDAEGWHWPRIAPGALEAVVAWLAANAGGG